MVSFSKVVCGKPEELGPRSGVDIVGATAASVVPAKPPRLKERLDAFVLVAGDVGEHGVALTSGMRWIHAAELDVEGEGQGFDLRHVVAFRWAHVSDEKVELVYSIRKGN